MMIFDSWMNEPAQSEFAADGCSGTIKAPAKTDYFEDPASDVSVSGAAFRYTEVSGDFTLTATVEPAFASNYDAGALFLWAGPTRWVKYALELTDLGYPCAVSVVTDGKSDDANGERVDSPRIDLRLARKGHVIGLYHRETVAHAGEPGPWKMSRLFRFATEGPVRVGVVAQSPTGEGCEVRFEDIDLSKGGPEDMRKGE